MDREKIADLFTRNGIILAYLFGSQKDEGVAFLNEEEYLVNSDADLDIAVLFGQPPSDIFNTYGELYAALSDAFTPFNIDVVFMHEVKTLFLYEIICGFNLYARDDDFASDYEERVVKLASDLMFKKKTFDRDVIEAMKDGYFEITA